MDRRKFLALGVAAVPAMQLPVGAVQPEPLIHYVGRDNLASCGKPSSWWDWKDGEGWRKITFEDVTCPVCRACKPRLTHFCTYLNWVYPDRAREFDPRIGEQAMCGKPGSWWDWKDGSYAVNDWDFRLRMVDCPACKVFADKFCDPRAKAVVVKKYYAPNS